MCLVRFPRKEQKKHIKIALDLNRARKMRIFQGKMSSPDRKVGERIVIKITFQVSFKYLSPYLWF